MKHIIFLATLSILANAALADNTARGKELFAQRCASCHGNEGKGDGPVAAALPPDQKPRNLSEGTNKFATDDAKLKQLLKDGGMAHGLSPMMPPQPDLPDTDLDAIITFVKSLHK